MRDFLKSILATVIGVGLVASAGFFGFLVLLIAIVSSASQETGPVVEDKTVLTFDLAREITDSSPITTPGEVLDTIISGDASLSPIALQSVLASLEQAAEDDRIVALYLYGSISPTGLGSGFATLREVREALQTFQASGKPIYAYAEVQWNEKDYYLASVADTIIQHPSGALELNGFSSENLFFANALEKYGIGVQVLRVGKYKSAIEPFTRNNSSPEQEQQTRQLLTDLWNEFVAATTADRDLTPQQLQTIVDQQALLLANEAEAAGLVDRVAFEDEIATEFRTLTDTEADATTFYQIGLNEYADVAQSGHSQSANQIAVVYAEGEIVSGIGGPRLVGGDALSETLREVREDDAVKAVVLRVNSPGGSATASEQIAREVLLTTQEKPVIVSMGSYAASGGYEISAHADRIFASPTTITGSIGVFGLLPNFQEIANNNGITWDGVKIGRYADLDTVSRPKTPQELAIAQRIVDQIYDRFISIVAESRNLPKEQVNEVAQGRVWSGVEAQKVGLVDEMGGLDAAVQAAAEAAELGEDWRIEEYPKSPASWFELLVEPPAAETSSFPDPLTLELEKLQADLNIVRSMNDPFGAYTRLPFNLRIE